MLVMLSRKMVRSFSAKFSFVRLPDTAYLYTPCPTGSFTRCICLMSREMVAWVLLMPRAWSRESSCSCVSIFSWEMISRIMF